MNVNTSFIKYLRSLLRLKLYIGRSLTTVPPNSLILFPCCRATFHCGLAGIVAVKSPAGQQPDVDLDNLEMQFKHMNERSFGLCSEQNLAMEEQYLNGREALDRLFAHIKKN